MKRTQGEREPPEHGLKKWWRDHPRDKKQKKIGCGYTNYIKNSCTVWMHFVLCQNLGSIHKKIHSIN
jgi:hypothetical protein